MPFHPKLLTPLVFAPLLLACVQAEGQAVPASVQLTSERLSLQLSDGTTCRLQNWQAQPVGRLSQCGPGYGYAVQVPDRPGLVRRMLEDADVALSGGRLLAPIAEVVITDPAGIDHIFSLPRDPD